MSEGFLGDFVITGEPTDLHVGVAAKGVVAMRLRVDGLAAHGATPWLGENAILRAIDVFRAIQSLPFASRSSELFDRPSINLGRILGGDALNKVPDTCYIDVDVRYLPEQDPDAILAEVDGIPGASIVSTFRRPPAMVDPESPFVRALCAAAATHHHGEVTSVGRDGASDAVSFLRAGVPAVEFGPVGGGHHGPEEWVSVSSLASYRSALVEFSRALRAQPAGRRRRGGGVSIDDETREFDPEERREAEGNTPEPEDAPQEQPEATDDAGDADAGEHEAPPPPATYAGRRRAEAQGADEPEAEEPRPSSPRPSSLSPKLRSPTSRKPMPRPRTLRT